ncbi:GumC family protein [Ancylobacter lacus]|uniref:GumC family protein n=1 Tax=Ancylobacter lacus TaxID=2579970 RepID=UPI001BCACF96|nr:polysaccharide biosynthesis tyrosine autokinase [Ancylobacter lacus]
MQHEASHEQQSSFLNPEILQRYWRVLRRRTRLILMIVGVFCFLGFVVTLLMPSSYRATVTLQLEPQAAKIVNVEGVQPEMSKSNDKAFYETQYALLESRSLAERVVKSLNLDTSPEFMGSDKKGGVGAVIDAVLGKGDAPAEQMDESQLAQRRRNAVDRLLTMIIVTPERNSQLVDVSVSGRDPAMVARIANAIGENFISSNLDRRFDASSYARRFLEDRLAEVKLKLQESEKELVDYAQSESIVDTNDDRSLVEANLAALNDSLAQAQADRITNEELWKQAEATSGDGLAEVIQNDTVGKLRERLAASQAEYQQKLSQYKPAFPAMVQLKAQIDELQLQLMAQVDLVKSTIKARYEASLSREKLLADQVDKLKSDVLAQRDRSIQYNILRREVQANKTLYEGLLQRFKEVGIAGGVGLSNVSIIDRAEPPRFRYSPKLSLNLIFSAMLGLIAGVGAAFGLEMMDETLKSPDQAEAKVGLQVLGVIPLIDTSASVLDLIDSPRSDVAESYRSLRTAIQFATAGGMPKSLLVTSSQPGEGKTTTTWALAKGFAQLGFKVLLIDVDLRRPSMHRLIGVPNTVGLSDYLSGSKPLGELIQTPFPNLSFISSGSIPEDPTELLAGARMTSLLSFGASHFDIILLDGPPILEIADAPLLASLSEGTLMVVSANMARHTVVRNRLKRLQQARVKVLGVVMTKFDMRNANSYYYYSGYYSGAYDYHPDIEKDEGWAVESLAKPDSGTEKKAEGDAAVLQTAEGERPDAKDGDKA